MKVVQTYGREMLEYDNFVKYLGVWKQAKTDNGCILAVGIGIFVTFMFMSFGCQFLIGA
jgi:hypothetical protein